MRTLHCRLVQQRSGCCQPFHSGVQGRSDRIQMVVWLTVVVGNVGWLLHGHLFDSPDTALFEPKDPGVAPLLLEVGLQFIPCTEVLSAIIANDRRLGASVVRNPQPNCEAVGTFQSVIEILLRRHSARMHRVTSNRKVAGAARLSLEWCRQRKGPPRLRHS